MHSKHVLQNLVEDLDRISNMICDLASCSEFQKQRDEYLKYYHDIKYIEKELQKDCNSIAEYETYTGTLDRI